MTVNGKLIGALAAAVALAGSAAAHAQEAKPATKPVPAAWDWSVCKAEIEKNCKAVDGKNNEAIYACLFKFDIENSPTCDAAHTKYEIETGRK